MSNKAYRDMNKSYSDIGEFSRIRKIFGVKHDFNRFSFSGGKRVWRISCDKRWHAAKSQRQKLSQGHADHLEALQEDLRRGASPKSGVIVVWMAGDDDNPVPVEYWRPGMDIEDRKPITAEKLERWLSVTR